MDDLEADIVQVSTPAMVIAVPGKRLAMPPLAKVGVKLTEAPVEVIGVPSVPFTFGPKTQAVGPVFWNWPFAHPPSPKRVVLSGRFHVLPRVKEPCSLIVRTPAHPDWVVPEPLARKHPFPVQGRRIVHPAPPTAELDGHCAAIAAFNAGPISVAPSITAP